MNFSAPGFGSALRCTSSRRKSGFNGLDRKRLLFLSAEEFAISREIGGRNVSRLALWSVGADETPRLYFCLRAHAGPRHRREHGDLQRRQRLSVQTAASQ